MASKIKIELDHHTHELIKWALEMLREPGGIPGGLECQALVLLNFQERNLVKILYSKPPFTIKLMSYEACALSDLMFRISMPDIRDDIWRNNLCDNIQKQLPINFQRYDHA